VERGLVAVAGPGRWFSRKALNETSPPDAPSPVPATDAAIVTGPPSLNAPLVMSSAYSRCS
jgi:hypothetical protein